FAPTPSTCSSRSFTTSSDFFATKTAPTLTPSFSAIQQRSEQHQKLNTAWLRCDFVAIWPNSVRRDGTGEFFSFAILDCGNRNCARIRNSVTTRVNIGDF